MFKSNYNKNYFENIFYKEKSNSQRNRKRFIELLNYKKRGSLLEIGCGEGFFLLEANKSFDVEGIEISEYVIANNKTSLKGKITKGDIERFKLQPNYYDVIVTFNVIEHLKNPKKVIHKLCRSLKDNGVLMGSVPNNYGLVGGLVTLISNIFDKTHRSTHSPKIWNKYFVEAGFDEISNFGEITFGRNRCFYLKNCIWRYLSFNLMFVCRK